MGKADEAMITFEEGFNCSQAVLAAFSCDFGLDPIMAYRVAAGFGGGMGHMGEICGAVTGAFMVIGLKYGMTVLDGSQSHREAFAKVREFAEKFRTLHGSIVCRDLLGLDVNDRYALREASKKGIPQKICPKLVWDAAEIVEDLIK
ncbi:MAG: C-GCAxxG-C-C family protein [Dehalococcoidia bacterium]|jgi:C_GCAxxG_C_C family probable redox protein